MAVTPSTPSITVYNSSGADVGSTYSDLQTALNATLDGYKIVIGAGTLTVASSLNIATSVTIQGAGLTTVINGPAAGNYLVNLAGAGKTVAISDVAVTGHSVLSETQTGGKISWTNSTFTLDVTGTDNNFYAASPASQFVPGSSGYQFVFTGNTVNYSGTPHAQSGVLSLFAGGALLLVSNTFTDTGTANTNNQEAVNINSSSGTLASNKFVNADIGVLVANASHDLLIAENTFTGSVAAAATYGRGVFLFTPAFTGTGVTVMGNSFTNLNFGIVKSGFDSGSIAGQTVVTTGNTFTGDANVAGGGATGQFHLVNSTINGASVGSIYVGSTSATATDTFTSTQSLSAGSFSVVNGVWHLGSDTLQNIDRVVDANQHVFRLVGATSAYATIQSAVDAAAVGETILIAPGSYTETSPYVVGSQGLHISTAGLTLVGFSSDTGTVVTSAAQAKAYGPTIISGAENNFGANHWIDKDADNVTLSGLHFEAGADTTNKVLEIWGDNVVITNDFIDTNKPDGSSSGASAIYLNDTAATYGSSGHITTYRISENILTDGVVISNGVGTAGAAISPAESIVGNIFTGSFDPATGLGRYDAVVDNGQQAGVDYRVAPNQVPLLAANTISGGGDSAPFLLRGVDNNAANLPTAAQVATILANNFAGATYAYALTSSGALATADATGGSPSTTFHRFAVANSLNTLNLALDKTADSVFDGTPRAYYHTGDTLILNTGATTTSTAVLVDGVTVQATAASTALTLRLGTTFSDGTALDHSVKTLALGDYATGLGANVNVTGNDLGDTISGNSGDNVLKGGAGADTFVPGAGTDKIDGGAGVDTVKIGAALTTSNFSYDASSGAWTVKGAAGADTLVNVEKVVDGAGKTFLLVGGGSAYAHVQDAVDAANPGGTILIAPGAYHESTKSTQGPVALDINKANLTLIGFSSDTGKAIDNAADAGAFGPTLISDAQAPFGANFFIEQGGDGVTLSGLHLAAGATTTNKVLEIWGDDVTVTDSFIDTAKPSGDPSGASAIYINDTSDTNGSGGHITAYHIVGNLLNEGIVISNGVGTAGAAPSADQEITNNVFESVDGGFRFDTIVDNGHEVGVNFRVAPNQVPLVSGNSVGDYAWFLLRGVDSDASKIPTAAQVASILSTNFTDAPYVYVLSADGSRLATWDVTSGGATNHHFAVSPDISIFNLGLDATTAQSYYGDATIRDYYHTGDILVLNSGSDETTDDVMVDGVKVQATAASIALTINLAAQHYDGSATSVKTLTLTDYASGLGANVAVTGNNSGDTITGNSGANVITGGDGADVLKGGAGNDTLNGGKGIDQALYNALPTAAPLYDAPTSTWIVNSASEGTDRLSSIEQITSSAGSAKILLVGGGSSYTTVQQAINDAATGDQIYYAAGSDTTVTTPKTGVTVSLAPSAAPSYAPVFTSGSTATTPEDVAVNTAVYVAQASDADGDTLVYKISGGADAAQFSINSASGAVTFNTPPDFETPLDAAHANNYNLIVQASDGVHVVTQAVAISVTNIDDAPISVTSVGPGQTQMVDTGSGTTLTGMVAVKGTLEFVPPTPTSSMETPPPVTFAGSISGTGSVEKMGSGTLTLAGVSTYTGPTKVDGGLLVVDGSIASSPVRVGAGATLGGHGTTGTVTLTDGATFSPGNSPGTINTGNLTLTAGAMYKQEVGGFGGGQFDLVNVTGTVALNNATLNLSLYNNYVPTTGSSALVIINNDGTDAVTGTFAGLAEGASVKVGASTATISYRGGTGNDVTLTFAAPAAAGGGGGGGGGGGTTITPTTPTTTPTTPPTPTQGQQTNFAAQFTNLLRATPTSADALDPTNPIYTQYQASLAIASQYAAGTITQAAAQSALNHLVDGTISVATLSYAFFTGKTPTSDGLDYLVHSSSNPADLNDAYYLKFNTDNRYINFAAALAKGGAGTAAYHTAYDGLTLSDTVTKAYTAIFGAAPVAGKVDAILNSLVPDGLGGQETRAQYFAFYGQDGLNGTGTKAAAIGFLLSDAIKEGLGPYQQADQHFLNDLGAGSGLFNVDLVGTYGPNGTAGAPAQVSGV